MLKKIYINNKFGLKMGRHNITLFWKKIKTKLNQRDISID